MVGGNTLADGPQSDDFNRYNLDLGLWTLVDPLGDGIIRMDGADTGDAVLELEVAAGVSHDPWNDNRALSVMQPITDQDFEVEVSFQSEPHERYQMQGLFVEQDANDWLRFDFYFDGSNVRVFCARTLNGKSKALLNQAIDPGDGMGLRITRVGSQWTIAYDDAVSGWTTAGSIAYSLTATSIGVFAANHGSSGNSPGFVAVVDDFINTAVPPAGDGAPAPLDVDPPLIHGIAARATGANEFEIAWNTDERCLGGVWFEGNLMNDAGNLYAHAVTLSGLTEGQTYQYEIVSDDGFGNVSSSGVLEFQFYASGGPLIDVWYGDQQSFGQTGQPQIWVNILGNVFDNDGVSSLTYRLNGGSSQPLSIGPDNRRLENAGDFNVDLATADLVDGANTVEITATDGLGEVSTRTVDINFASSDVWPLPYELDWDALAQGDDISDVTWIVDGKWHLEDDGSRTVARTTEPGYDRLVGIGDVLWDDYEFQIPITLHTKPGGCGVGILLRWNGHTDSPVSGWQPKSGWLPLGAILWAQTNRIQIYGNGGDILGNKSMSLAIDVPYIFKGRVETIPGVGSEYSFKVWEEGTPEPPDWDITGMEELSDPQFGSMLLISHLSDASFGPVSVAEVESLPDTTPPVISNISVNASVESATISWTTDEPADSMVEFGLTSLYGNSESDATNTLNHNIVLNGLTAETEYHFRVHSTDPSGNHSQSADLTFTTDAVGVPSDIASDEFNGGSLDTAIWTFLDPVGDGSLVMTGSQVSISVPAGVDHDLWTAGIRTPRIVQQVSDADFHVEFKMDSMPSAKYQLQGLIVEENDDHFLRFGTYSTGSKLMAFVASMHNGSATVYHNKTITMSAPYYMRVERIGNTWSQSYSDDGTNWTVGGVIGSDPLTMNTIGLYCGAAIGNTSPGHTSLFDYFRNLDEAESSASGTRPACPSDLNVDGLVDVSDLLLLLATWGTAESGADLNGSGIVDVGDLLILLGKWGMCPS